MSSSVEIITPEVFIPQLSPAPENIDTLVDIEEPQLDLSQLPPIRPIEILSKQDTYRPESKHPKLRKVLRTASAFTMLLITNGSSELTDNSTLLPSIYCQGDYTVRDTSDLDKTRKTVAEMDFDLSPEAHQEAQVKVNQAEDTTQISDALNNALNDKGIKVEINRLPAAQAGPFTVPKFFTNYGLYINLV